MIHARFIPTGDERCKSCIFLSLKKQKVRDLACMASMENINPDGIKHLRCSACRSLIIGYKIEIRVLPLKLLHLKKRKNTYEELFRFMKT